MAKEFVMQADVLATNLVQIVKANVSDMSPEVTLHKLFLREIVSACFAGLDYKLKLED